MKFVELTYLGPRDSLNVGGYGPHRVKQKKEYPEEVAEELLASEKHEWKKGKTREEVPEETEDPEAAGDEGDDTNEGDPPADPEDEE